MGGRSLRKLAHQTQNVTSLVRETETYQMDIIRLTSMHSVGFWNHLLEREWTFFHHEWNHTHGENKGWCGSTCSTPTWWQCIGVFPRSQGSCLQLWMWGQALKYPDFLECCRGFGRCSSWRLHCFPWGLQCFHGQCQCNQEGYNLEEWPLNHVRKIFNCHLWQSFKPIPDYARKIES